MNPPEPAAVPPVLSPRGFSRRSVLGAAAAGLAVLAAGCSTTAPPSTLTKAPPSTDPVLAAADDLAGLEQRFAGRLGVCVVDTGSGAQVSHRPDERFLLCSTGKVLTVSAVQRLAATQPGLLDRLLRYDASAVLEYAPVTSQHVRDGMTVAQLCDAAITVSDNTAANLLVALLGGPPAVTAFARSLGDGVTRVDRIEPELNVTSPGDERDTSTPAQMAADLRSLLLGTSLPAAGRDRLTNWMHSNTTGAKGIRAGVPANWTVGDKTGSGAQGERNDVAVAWPPGRAPVIISIYTAPEDPASPGNQTVIAEAARIATSALIHA